MPMTRPALVVAGLLLAGSTCWAQDRPIVLEHVTVIPATGAPSLSDATVILENGRIRQVGDSRLVRPSNARVISGRGKFLIPGLFEMHSHVSKARGSALGLFVVNGVTTIRDMGGDHAELLQWRREIRAGTRLGPRMLIAGPYLESATNANRQRSTPPAEMAEPVERTRIPVGSPSEARRVVDSLAALELDYLKIRTVQGRDTWFEIVRAARARGLRVVGHASAGPEVVLASGQHSVEHGFYPGAPDSLPREARMQLWRRLADSGIGVVPTLATVTQSVMAPHQRLLDIVGDSLGRVEPRRRYLSRFLLIDWAEQVAEDTEERRAWFRRVWEPSLAQLREMREAGVRLMPGTDVGVLNIYPGSTLHDELANFVTLLGFTPAQALEAATRSSAEFLGLADSLGTIEAGKVADLVLLDADPWQDVRNTLRINTVFLRGRPLDRSALDSVLRRIETAPDRAVNDWRR